MDGVSNRSKRVVFFLLLEKRGETVRSDMNGE